MLTSNGPVKRRVAGRLRPLTREERAKRVERNDRRRRDEKLLRRDLERAGLVAADSGVTEKLKSAFRDRSAREDSEAIREGRA